MIIAETKTWRIGRYTVRQQPRFDNPAWAQYLVFATDKLIGKSFSCPDLALCDYLDYQQRDKPACTRAKAPALPLRGVAAFRKGRPTNAERERRAALLLTEEEPV